MYFFSDLDYFLPSNFEMCLLVWFLVFRFEDRVLETFLAFWGRSVSLSTSFLELFLLSLTDFEMLYFHFHLSWNIFWFPLWFFHWPIGFLSSLLFSFPLFLYNWLPVSYCVWKKMLDVSSLLLSLFWPRGQQQDKKDWCRHSAWVGCRLWWSGHRQRLVVLLICCLWKHQ